MADMIHKLRTRLLAWDWDTWNHARRVVVLTPLLILAGGAASILLQIGLAHRDYTVGLDGVMTLLFIMTSLIAGYIVLALLD